jgi:UDP-glucose 4-epimerase
MAVPTTDVFFGSSTHTVDQPKTILVTGGTGYIGSVFVDHYAKAHPAHQLIVVTRQVPSTIETPKHPNVQYIQADYGDQNDMQRILTQRGVSQVLHLAAGLENADSVENIAKCQALFEAMDASGVKQLVYGSSLMVYQKPTNPDGCVSEEAAIKEPSCQEYGAAKVAVEDLIKAHPDWKSVILRYAIAIGTSPDGTIGDKRPPTGILASFFKAALNSTPYEMGDNGQKSRDFVDVHDIATATEKALDWLSGQKNNQAVTLNVGSGRPEPFMELKALIESVSNKVINVNFKDRAPYLPVYFLDISRIKELLGWEPEVPLATSIKNDWQFFIRQQVTNNV